MAKRQWTEAFLASVALGNTVAVAAEHAGVHRATAFRKRHSDPEFAARWKEATESGLDMLEQEAWRRAQEKSDVLLIFLLKSRRREVFGDRITHAGDKTAPVAVTVDWKAALAQKLAAIATRRASGAENPQ